MPKPEDRKGLTAQSWQENPSCVCTEDCTAIISAGDRGCQFVASGRVFQPRKRQCCWRDDMAASPDHRHGEQREWNQMDGRAFLFLCYCGSSTFSGVVLSYMAEGLRLFTPDRSVKPHPPWRRARALQPLSGLSVQVAVIQGTAFLCRGGAGELLQAFIVFLVWEVLEQRTRACLCNQSLSCYEQCYLSSVLSDMLNKSTL